MQLLLGTALIEKAPTAKTIVVTGAFDDPMEVRCSDPDLNEEADTRIILSVIHSTAEHIIVESQDTDVFAALVTNYKHLGQKNP